MITRRVSGLLVVEVNCGNPNGDVDNGGGPRVFHDGYGWISDVSLKSRLRSSIQDQNGPVFQGMVERVKIKDVNRFHILESPMRGFNVETVNEAVDELKKLFVEQGELVIQDRFIDGRWFGYTSLWSGKNKDENAGQFKRTGCISIHIGKSVCPVIVEHGTISKSNPFREKDGKIMENDLAPEGRKFVRHGLYVVNFTIDPQAGMKTNLSEEDVAAFRFLLPRIFDHTASTARPAGSVRMVRAWWREHDGPLASFNEFAFARKLTPVRKGDDPKLPSESIDDYIIPDGTHEGAVDLLDEL